MFLQHEYIKAGKGSHNPEDRGAAKTLAEEGLFPLHLQKQSKAELCLHTAKPDAFLQLNPFPCYFSFFLQSKLGSCGFPRSHGAAGWEKPWSAVAVARQEEEQEGNQQLQAVRAAGQETPPASLLGKGMVLFRQDPTCCKVPCPLQRQGLPMGGCDNASSKLPD